MITTLHIKNIGIIDEITINLNEGFNVLTGETGAGKTLIIDSLNTICGARFSKEMIRKGEKSAIVEASLYLPNSEIAEDASVIVTREIFDNGRNLCKINGRLVTVSELKEFMKYHLDIHGQFDNQIIMDEVNHIEYLDNFAKFDISSIKEKYLNKYNEYIMLKQKLKENFGDEKQRQRTLDLLKYELEEIENADLKIGEEEFLKERAELIKNSEKIHESLTYTKSSLEENILNSLDDTLRQIAKISNINSKYETILNNLQESYYNLEDELRNITNELDKMDFNEEEAVEVLKRTDLICNLKRKYGSSIKEILEYKEEVKEKISRIENVDEENNKLQNQINNLLEEMESLAIKLNKIRTERAFELSEKINSNFKDLEMNNAEIKVEIIFNRNKDFNINGLDKVRFLICTNKGDEFKSLVKIASGGEISRIVLAMKSVLSDVDSVESCVFDEIDTGISGKAANSCGSKIKKIAKKHQVICVTHLAPVAAYADYHYYISKAVENNVTKTNIKLLNSEEKVKELARISSGKINEVTLKYAMELTNSVVLV